MGRNRTRSAARRDDARPSAARPDADDGRQAAGRPAGAQRGDDGGAAPAVEAPRGALGAPGRMDGRSVVVGAGLTGLALAHALRRAGNDVLVLEERAVAGGNLRSERVTTPEGPWLLDLGPNSFGDAPTAMTEFVRELGLEPRLVRASSAADRRWLWRAGRLREVPTKPPRFLFSSLLPLSGRLRILREPWIRPRPEDAPEETLAAFCDRRLGRLARTKLLTAIVGGIYAGDPERLGAESAFPRMIALERKHGSLLRAAIRGSGPPSRGRLVSFPDGLQEIAAAAARSLGASLRTGSPVARVDCDGAGVAVVTAAGERIAAGRVFVTSPADRTAELVQEIAPDAAEELRAIHYARVAVVHVGVPTTAAAPVPDGFGFLVPRDEGLRILGAILSSRLFPGRAPPGHELLTVFVGGDLDPSAPDLDDAAIRRFVLADLRRALGPVAEPALFRVTRWPRAIPQYHVGHAARLARIGAATRRLPGLRLAGNWRGGIAMPECVREAFEAAAGGP